MVAKFHPLHGLVAATFTPMRTDGSVDIDAIGPMVDELVRQGIAAFYVLGSTGEGPSLEFHERCEVAAPFVNAAAGGLPISVLATPPHASYAELPTRLDWKTLPVLPGELGKAGPFVGVHADHLIVAGGANFAKPVWESDKEWHDQIHVLELSDRNQFAWKDGGQLRSTIGYGAAVSTRDGMVCIGGNDAQTVFDRVFLLRWDPETQTVQELEYPSLPKPCAYGQAALVGNVIYLAGGQSAVTLDSAMNNFWSLDLSQKSKPNEFRWEELDAWSSEPRAFNITATQHNGNEQCVYVISGRRQSGDRLEFLRDIWEYSPTRKAWRRRQDAPRSFCAGTGIGLGKSQVCLLSGDDGSLFDKADELKDDHPGFVKEAFAYDTIADTWRNLGATPQNQVTTNSVRWNDRIILASGEVRPRVRTTSVWGITSADAP